MGWGGGGGGGGGAAMLAETSVGIRGLIYYVGCLGQTRVSLPEQLISEHRHIMARGHQPDTNARKPPSACEIIPANTPKHR